MQEALFQAAKTPGTFFFGEKKPPARLHHTEVRIGDAATNCLPQSKYPDIQSGGAGWDG